MLHISIIVLSAFQDTLLQDRFLGANREGEASLVLVPTIRAGRVVIGKAVRSQQLGAREIALRKSSSWDFIMRKICVQGLLKVWV
jgi:hypothetical protein